MSALKELMENTWVLKDKQKDLYYQCKHEESDYKKFIQNILGWRWIQTEKLVKIEKIPAHAEGFMGIQEFTDIHDYCILCVLLMYLEDQEDGSQFLLSEMIRYTEAILKEYMEVDWTSYSQRKSFVRVIQYLESTGMLKVYEGKSQSFLAEPESEVLYENTGISRYFATHFGIDISQFTSWQDFEKKQMDELEETKGDMRIHRVYRNLVLCPYYHWNNQNDAEALYIKNQRSSISLNLKNTIGGDLDVRGNTAALIYVDEEPVGDSFPRMNMLQDIILLVLREIQDVIQNDISKLTQDDLYFIPKDKFMTILAEIRTKYMSLWSKEYREQNEERYKKTVLEFMKKWKFIGESEEHIVIYPICAYVSGQYSKYMEGKVNA